VVRPVPGGEKGINSCSDIGAQDRAGPRRPEGNAVLAALPGVLGRGRLSVVARPCPALYCRRRSAWCGAGKPRLAGLCTAAGLLGLLAHLALACFSALRRYISPWGLLLLGAVPLGDTKRLALPRRLAYYRPDKERDQRASAAGADDCSSPAARGLRQVGTR
jgi:hypothetical protein